MLTDEEIRDEALRLATLDQAGLNVEAVVVALRMGRQSEIAMDDMASLDRGALDEWKERSGDFGSSGLSSPGGDGLPDEI